MAFSYGKIVAALSRIRAERRRQKGREVEASVARCLRTPPEGATPQGLFRDYRTALSSETCLNIVVICNYRFSPITVVQCREKARSLHPRRSYFAPIRSCCIKHVAPQQLVVEAPGTAPGSEWLITSAVYRHSRSSRHAEYRDRADAMEGPFEALADGEIGEERRKAMTMGRCSVMVGKLPESKSDAPISRPSFTRP